MREHAFNGAMIGGGQQVCCRHCALPLAEYIQEPQDCPTHAFIPLEDLLRGKDAKGKQELLAYLWSSGMMASEGETVGEGV